MSTVLWLLTAFGITWIVNRSFFFAWLRRLLPKPEGETPFFGILIRCPQCFGFWVGVLLHDVGYRAIPNVWPSPVWPWWMYPAAGAVLSAAAASGFCAAANTILNKLGQGPIEEY